LRVGLFSNAYHPLISGVVNSLEGIRTGLLQAEHQVYLFAPKVRGYRDEQPGVFRFASLEMTKRVSYPIPIPYSGRLFKMIRKLDLDIIHAHHPILLGEVAASFAHQKRVPLVYTFHTQLEHYSHYIPLNQHVVKGMARSRLTRYLSKCDLVIAPSDGIRGLLDSYGFKGRVATLPNAIDTARFTATVSGQDWRLALGISRQATVSLSVGRLGREKNLDFLLTSFAKLPQSSGQPEHMLVLVGEGTEKPRLAKLAADLGIAQRVRFTGAVPYADMPAVYAACDLFVICSTTEVKPLVVLEALASGLPVLAVAACGTSDTLHHGFDGWLSPPHAEAYCEGWLALVEGAAFRQMLGAGGRQTAKAYSFDSYLRRLCELYRESIAEYRRRPSLQVGAGARDAV
jgi:glycosyltransferase involved in cell wall biosynthesis